MVDFDNVILKSTEVFILLIWIKLKFFALMVIFFFYIQTHY